MTSPLSPEAVAQMVADREAGTPGPWLYRPGPYDDWGVVKAGHCVLCQVRDPEAIDEAILSAHRRNGTDPWEANASRIARLPDLEAAYLTLAAENATLQRDYDRATVTAAQFMADAVQRLETAERANATLRAERDAAQAGWDDQKARHKGCFSSMWKNLLRALDAEQERDTLRASEAAAMERVAELEAAACSYQASLLKQGIDGSKGPKE